MVKLAGKKTIDDLAEPGKNKFFPIDVFRFCYDEYVKNATDYSAFSGLSKQGMIFDAKVKRLEESYGYLKALLGYAKEKFDTTSRVKQKEIVKAGQYIKKELESLMNGSHLSRPYANGGRIEVGEKPEPYKENGNYVHMVPIKRTKTRREKV